MGHRDHGFFRHHLPHRQSRRLVSALNQTRSLQYCPHHQSYAHRKSVIISFLTQNDGRNLFRLHTSLT